MVSRFKAILLVLTSVIVIAAVTALPSNSITGLFVGPANCTEVPQELTARVPYERELQYLVANYDLREEPSGTNKLTRAVIGLRNLDSVEGEFTVIGTFTVGTDTFPAKKSQFVPGQTVVDFEFTHTSPLETDVEFSFDVRAAKVTEFKEETYLQNVTTCT